MPPRTTGTHTWNIGHLSPKTERHVQHVISQWCRCEVTIEELTDNEVRYNVPANQ